jgi:hypothetical protein
VGAALAALRVLRGPDGPPLLAQVLDNARYLRDGLEERGFAVVAAQPLPDGGDVVTPIVPVLVGDDWKAALLWRALYDAGVFVNTALHPAVPPGGALLRTSVMATHDRATLDEALAMFSASRPRSRPSTAPSRGPARTDPATDYHRSRRFRGRIRRPDGIPTSLQKKGALSGCCPTSHVDRRLRAGVASSGAVETACGAERWTGRGHEGAPPDPRIPDALSDGAHITTIRAAAAGPEQAPATGR